MLTNNQIFEGLGELQMPKDQSGSELPEKRTKMPDPPGLEPGTLLVMML